MRLTVALLVLLNIMVVLWVHRLPGGERPEPRPSNLPRVAVIDTLGVGEGIGLGGGERETCFRVAGFLSQMGAHDWLKLRGLDPSLHTVSRIALVEREVGLLRVNYPPGVVSSSPSSVNDDLIESGWLIRRSSDGGLQAGVPLIGFEPYAGLTSYRSENKRIFILESTTMRLYSYAVTGSTVLAGAWRKRSTARASGRLEGKRCESIAKPRQNP